MWRKWADEKISSFSSVKFTIQIVQSKYLNPPGNIAFSNQLLINFSKKKKIDLPAKLTPPIFYYPPPQPLHKAKTVVTLSSPTYRTNNWFIGTDPNFTHAEIFYKVKRSAQSRSVGAIHSPLNPNVIFPFKFFFVPVRRIYLNIFKRN